MIQKKIYLDFYNHNINSLRVKQNDSGRTVEVVCTDSGKKYFLDSDIVRVYILFNKKDGTFSFKEGTITEDGTVLIEFTSPMTSVVGKQSMEILIVKSEGLNVENLSGVACYEDFGANVISTMPLYVTVIGSVVDSSEITSLSEFDALTNALIRLSETEDHMKAVDAILNTNEQQRKDQEDEREKQEGLRQSKFETNEAKRQSDFETNESARQSTFELSETARETIFNGRTAEYDRTIDECINGEDGYTAQVNAVIQECKDTFEENESGRATEFEDAIQGYNETVKELIEGENGYTAQVDAVIKNCSDTFTTNEASRWSTFESNESTRETIFNGRIAGYDRTIETKVSEITTEANTVIERVNEAVESGAVFQNEKGVADGIATLDEDGVVPSEQLPIVNTLEAALASTGYIFDAQALAVLLQSLHVVHTGTEKPSNELGKDGDIYMKIIADDTEETPVEQGGE